MLTLKTAQIPTLEIELTDGECIHVLPATKRLIETMGNVNTADMAVTYRVLSKILSYNREGRAVTEEDLSEVPFPVLIEIMNAYTDFIKGKVAGAKN